MADNKNTNAELSESCFVIMPISDQVGYPQGHFTNIYNQIFIPAIEEAGFKPYRVDENAICDSIINKIFDAIQQCPIALCDLSSRNPNVLYELGLRQAYDKSVVLVQDEKTDRIFDVSGISTVSYKSDRLYENVIQARKDIKQAIQETSESKGKNSSLVRIVKSQSANFDNVTVSSNDKLEIVLNQIMGEIAGINRNIATKNQETAELYDSNATYSRVEKMSSFLNYAQKALSQEISLEKMKDVYHTLKRLQSENTILPIDPKELRELIQSYEILIKIKEIGN